ncbi:hypothetical protein M8J76_010622 [Diaphorina citri]|nr:hypothetical protein M8J76_010622 [Diaphorina citri]
MRSMFGVDFEIQRNHYSQHPYLEAVESSFQIFLMRVFKPWLAVDPFYTMSGCKARVRKNRSIQKEFMKSIIDEVERKIFEENVNFIDSKIEEEIPFLERVLRDRLDPSSTKNPQNSMTDKELLHEMVGVLNAGIDTVTFTTSIVLIVLAVHPQIQQEVRATIGIFIYGLHRHPQLWNNPNQFDPDRFLPSQSSHRNPSGYVPFSLGPRGCIGSKYAMLQMKTTISTILRRYKILPGDKCKSLQDIRFEFGMTMRSLPGNDIRIEPR